jgi:hypothetical protein
MTFKPWKQWISHLLHRHQPPQPRCPRRRRTIGAPTTAELFESRLLLSGSSLLALTHGGGTGAAHNSIRALDVVPANANSSLNSTNTNANGSWQDAAFRNLDRQSPAWWNGAVNDDGTGHDRGGDGDWSDPSTSTSGQHLVFTVEPADGTAGQSFTVTASVQDADGNVITGNDSTVVLRVADGPGDFSSGRTLTATAVDGVATFDNVVLDKAGTYTLSASGASSKRAESTSFTIAPDTTDAEQLAFVSSDTNSRNSNGCDHSSSDESRVHDWRSSSSDSSSSSTSTAISGTAGQPLSTFKVAVEDQFGNVVTSDNTSTVTVAINTGPTGATFDSASTLTATVHNGVATFDNVILDTAGSYTLSATDSNSAVTTAVSGTVTVSAASATQLVVQPVTASGTTGTALNPGVTVLAEDQFGNVATSDNSSVTLNVASSSPGGFGSGSETTVQAKNGVATFDNIIFDTATPLPAGTQPYFLFATQGDLTSANSNAIEILATS